MPTLTWKDSRLTADDVAPWNTTILFVSKENTVAEMVNDTKRWCDENSGGEGLHLMVYCHGSAGFLQICKEGITLVNVNKLAPLSPYFDDVSIHACEVAQGKAGRAFCTKMAQVLVAPVTASVHIQTNTGPATIYGYVDDMKYDGDYYIHHTSGARSGPITSGSGVSGGIVHTYGE